MATGEATSLRADRASGSAVQRSSEHLTALTIEDTRRRTTGEGENALERGAEEKSRREFTVERNKEKRGRREFTGFHQVLVFYEVQMSSKHCCCCCCVGVLV